MTVFSVDSRPDGGGFCEGDAAALAWDVLRKAGSRDLPTAIDLSACTHLKPYSIACLCALAELAKRQGLELEAIPPVNASCASHLARLGVPAFFSGGWDCADPRATNLPVRCVSWPPAGAAEDVVELVAPRVDLPPGVWPKMVGSLDEVIRNALTHAESQIDCIVAGQAFPGTDKVEIAVLDLGQTVRGHLAKHPDHSAVNTDSEALHLALQDGVTGTPPGQRNIRGEDNSGAGLAELRSYCEGGGGELTVLSGKNWVTCVPEEDPVIGNFFTGFQGCLVNIRYYTGNRLPQIAEEPIL